MSNGIFFNDLIRFWQNFETIKQSELKNWLWSDYIFKGSSQIRFFFKEGINDLNFFTEQLFNKRSYYLSIKTNSIEITQKTDLITDLVCLFETFFGFSVFPKFYFIIGSLNCGAITRDKDIIIAAEMYAKNSETDTSSLNLWERHNTEEAIFLQDLISHELAHLYQNYTSSNTLLAQCIKEGAADFIANKVIGIRLNSYIYDFGYQNEEIIKEQFKKDIDNTNWGKWLYNGKIANCGYPSDLGYFIGYRICESYYEKYSDKKQALLDITNINDFSVFTQKSNYL